MQTMNKREPRSVAEGIDRSADYDVVIIGGAFSGASSALLLKRQFADLRILIIERTVEFDRKVGESTSEVAGCFLTRVLRLGMHMCIGVCASGSGSSLQHSGTSSQAQVCIWDGLYSSSA